MAKNKTVSQFLDELNHPFRKEIEQLRICILSADTNLTENIKWNGPNYCFDNEDRMLCSSNKCNFQNERAFAVEMWITPKMA